MCRCGTPFSVSLYCTSTSPVCSWRRLAQLRERKHSTSKKKLVFSCVHFSHICLILNKLFNLFSSRHGDMRVMMAYELFSMWQKLGASVCFRRKDYNHHNEAIAFVFYVATFSFYWFNFAKFKLKPCIPLLQKRCRIIHWFIHCQLAQLTCIRNRYVTSRRLRPYVILSTI